MSRLLLMVVAVALSVAGAIWWVGADDALHGAAGGAGVVAADEASTADEAARALALSGLAAIASAPEALAVSDAFDPDALVEAERPGRRSSRLDRRTQARLLWEDGEPVAGALVDVLMGPFRPVFSSPTVSDPPAATSDGKGRIVFRALYAGQPHVGAVTHPDLLVPAAIRFEPPAEPSRDDPPLELVLPRPSRLELVGMDWPGELIVRLSQQGSPAVLYQHRGPGPEWQVDGLPMGLELEVAVFDAADERRVGAASLVVDDAVERVLVLPYAPAPALVGEQRGFDWRLVDGRGDTVSGARLAQAGGASTLPIRLVGSDGESERQQLERDRPLLEGELLTRLPPPWTLSVQLFGGTTVVEGVVPGQSVLLMVPGGLLDQATARVQFAAADGLTGVSEVLLTNADDVVRRVAGESLRTGELPVARVELPQGDYRYTAVAAVTGGLLHGALHVAPADVDQDRDVLLVFEGLGALSGQVFSRGLTFSFGDSLLLVPRSGPDQPDMPRTMLDPNGKYVLRNVPAGDYDLFVQVEVEGHILSLPAGSATVRPGDNQLDVFTDLVAEQRRSAGVLQVRREGLSRVQLRLTDAIGGQRVMLLASWKSAGQVQWSQVNLPAGFHRYEAWLCGKDGLWSRRVRGVLAGDTLTLAE